MQGSSGRKLLRVSSCLLKSRSIICIKESPSPFFFLHNPPPHIFFSSSYSKPEKDSPPLFFRRSSSWAQPWPPTVFLRASLRDVSSSAPSICGCGRQSPFSTSFVRYYSLRLAKIKQASKFEDASQQAVTTALWCNFLVFSLKFGVWLATSSHVMLAEVVHSVADIANQVLLAYGLNSSKRGPDALHPYGYSKERFVWSLISAVGIFCLGSGATIVHGIQNLWVAHPPDNIKYAAIVIGGSFILEGASLLVAVKAVKKGAAAEGMTIRDYVWRGHDPTSVAVMTEDGAAVTGLAIAGASLVAVHITGNPIYDPVGSIIVGNLLGMVAIFLIQRNRHALIGRAIDDHDMQRVLQLLKSDPVVDSLYDCKSEVIGPGFFRFKAEIDFNGVVVVQNYLKRTGREEWAKKATESQHTRRLLVSLEALRRTIGWSADTMIIYSWLKWDVSLKPTHKFREAAECGDDSELLKAMANYGEGLVEALGSEVDRLETEIQKIVPGIRHVDIEAHNPSEPST